MRKPKIGIACQGGGSQTAFTAGVLHALAEARIDKDFDIVSLSGNSGGAVCAAFVEGGAKVIGVNHRDLRTFAVDLGLTERLRKVIPSEVVLVSESGIQSVDDARRMREAGADAILVGESLMRSDDPAGRIRELASA